MINVKAYSEFLNGRESTYAAQLEYFRYLKEIASMIFEKINDNHYQYSDSDRKTLEDISKKLDALIKEKPNT